MDVTCLIIGSNDIVENYINREGQLAQDILQAAEDILNAGCKRVVILPILFRSGLAAVPRHLQATASQDDIMFAEHEYMMQAIEVNRRIKEACDHHPRISFRSR